MAFWLSKHFAFARTQFLQARTALAGFEAASLTALNSLRTASDATVPSSGGIFVSRARGVHRKETDVIFLRRSDCDMKSNAPIA